MFKSKLPIISLFLLVFLFIGSAHQSYSQTFTPTPTPDTSSKAKDLQDEVKQYQDKITELQSQAKTLSSQVKVMDSQIKLTELKILASQEEIEELNADIEVASGRITKLDATLENITKVLIKRIVATYQTGSTPPLEVLLSSSTVSNAITRSQYLKIVQEHDKRLVVDTAQAKNDYQNQKTIFEGKKEKVEALHKQLDIYAQQLDQQKVEKQNLLSATKNSESEYQKRLADALKELQQIQKAAQTLVSTEARKVTKGEKIGLMGNSGYSFGAHLHFGIYNITSLEQYNYYSSFENPANTLEAKSVDWDTGCGGDPTGQTSTGTGSFSWPMSTDSLHITQGSGITCYSNIYYKGKPHPAFDMYNNSDIVVRAVEEGQAYFCRNCTGDGGNGVFVFHPNGKMSLYWHLQ